jgi:hypothetical protein
MVSEFLQISPPEGSRLARLQSPSPLADTVERRPRLILIHSTSVGNKPRDCFAMPRDDDLFPALYAIQQGSQRVLGIEGADFIHRGPLSIQRRRMDPGENLGVRANLRPHVTLFFRGAETYHLGDPQRTSHV